MAISGSAVKAGTGTGPERRPEARVGPELAEGSGMALAATAPDGGGASGDAGTMGLTGDGEREGTVADAGATDSGAAADNA